MASLDRLTSAYRFQRAHESLALCKGQASSRRPDEDGLASQTPVRFAPDPGKGRMARFRVRLSRRRGDRSSYAGTNRQTHRPRTGGPVVAVCLFNDAELATQMGVRSCLLLPLAQTGSTIVRGSRGARAGRRTTVGPVPVTCTCQSRGPKETDRLLGKSGGTLGGGQSPCLISSDRDSSGSIAPWRTRSVLSFAQSLSRAESSPMPALGRAKRAVSLLRLPERHRCRRTGPFSTRGARCP
jgi:hypothetical protein